MAGIEERYEMRELVRVHAYVYACMRMCLYTRVCVYIYI